MRRQFILLFLIGAQVLTSGIAAAATARLKQARAWEKADANGDGVLSWQEARRMPRLARHFDAIDADRDGAITGGEVRAWRDSARVRNRPASGKGVDEVMRLADHNGDGLLTRIEFTQCHPRFAPRFDRIDVNRDGMLARNELADWLATRRMARPSKQLRQ